MTEETATLMRIFVDEAEAFGGKPVFIAIVDELRRQGFAGATVLKGIEGFGPHNVIHTMRSPELPATLPVLVEVAENRERIEAIVPQLRTMIAEGLITLERVRMELVRETPRP
jgi:uncharacterized protein